MQIPFPNPYFLHMVDPPYVSVDEWLNMWSSLEGEDGCRILLQVSFE